MDSSRLPPLEWLQTRRGSVGTDPFLHSSQQRARTPPRSNRQHDIHPISSSKGLAPKASYTFGEATARSGDNGNSGAQLRNLLRSPTGERPPAVAGLKQEEDDYDNLDGKSDTDRRVVLPSMDTFDYTMRRHSIAVGFEPSTGLLGKRKVSGNRLDVGVDDPRIDDGFRGLPGPPPPKRRGSMATEISRIADSLDDRRHSIASPSGVWRKDAGYRPFGPGDGASQRLPKLAGIAAWPPPSSREMDQPHPTQPLGFTGPMSFTVGPGGAPDMGMHGPDPTQAGPSRSIRSKSSRPPSRQTNSPDEMGDPNFDPSTLTSAKGGLKDLNGTPYSRSPELRVSHKLAERKRRKEMKDLFDELRDQLPADRGMKASKWEILSKAIDFIASLKQANSDMGRELEMLRHEVDIARQAGGLPPFGAPGGPNVFSQPPPGGVPPPGYLPPPPPANMQQPPPPDLSRPSSAQEHGHFPPPQIPPQNGSTARSEGTPT